MGRCVLGSLGKTAAWATIVGAIFTVITFFHVSNDRSEESDPSALISNDESKSTPVVRENSNEPPRASVVSTSPSDSVASNSSNASTASNSYVREAEIRTRFEAAIGIPGTSTRGSALQQLAMKASDLGFLPISFEIASKIPGTSTRSKTLSYVANKAAESGNLQLAIQIAEKIPNTSSRSQTLREISEM